MKLETLLLNEQDIQEAKKILLNGGIVAFPTETVFGLGVICNNEQAYRHLVEVKKRPETKPFTLMCSSIEQVKKYAVISKKGQKIIDTFMPGEITILLEPKTGIEPWINLHSNKIGIRIPDNKFVLDLISLVDIPLLVPSANPSDLPPALNSEEALKYFDGKIEAIVLGESGHHKPSTIIDLASKEVQIIREGNISIQKIKKCLGE